MTNWKTYFAVTLTCALFCAVSAPADVKPPLDPNRPAVGTVDPNEEAAWLAYKLELAAQSHDDGGGIAMNADNCPEATLLAPNTGTLPVSTSGATNTPADSAGACGASATTADTWGNYTPTVSGNVTFSFCPTTGGSSTNDTVLEAYTNCLTLNGTRIICNDDSCGLQSSITFAVVAGTTYKIRVSGFSGQVVSGTLGWVLLIPCSVTCPPGSALEGEPCGATPDLNNACNQTPPVFGSINCGQTKCGTTFSSTTTRDVDTYVFCHNGGDVTLAGASDVALNLTIFPTTCPFGAPIVATTTLAGSCAEASITAPALAAGIYMVLVSPTTFTAQPCTKNYYVRLTCTQGDCGSCCRTSGVCQITTAANCNAPGEVFVLGGACSGNCPTGACCVGANCSVVTQAGCSALAGVYQGNGTNCGAVTYTVTTGNNAIIDIQGTGTLGCAGDDCSSLVSLGFSFDFFGLPQTDINVGSNGHMRFGGPATTFGNPASLPSVTPYGNVIAPYWDDWRTDAVCPGSAIYTQTVGSSPNRQFIAQWVNICHFSNNAQHANFEAILNENNGDIEFRYGNPLDFNSPVAGIDDAAGTTGNDVTANALPNTSVLLHRNASNNPCNQNPCAGIVRGDSNGDGVVNNFDIDAFVAALTGVTCTADPVCRCRNDINRDGLVNNFDIDPFVQCLTSQCPP